jgi:putative ABC transport system permease protein
MSVAPNYFAMLGVKPQLGVTFDPADATPGFNEQAVISDGLWKRAFGGDSSVIGRIVQVDSDSYRIIGVMPSGFQPPEPTRGARATDTWSAFGFSGAPLSHESVVRRTPLFPGAIARLNAGLTIADAQRRVDALVETLRRQYPEDYPSRSDWRIRLVPLQDYVMGDLRQPLLFLLGAVVLVLGIGCANVANLLLARATSRGRELAVRQALGGARSRLVRQLLTESIVLSALGGVVAIALLLSTRSLFIRLVPDGVPRFNDITVNWEVLSFALVASLIAGAAFGLAPALHAGRLDVTRVLKQEGRGSSGSREQRRTRRLIVVAEFALSLVLMSAAGLLARSFWTMLRAPLGFDAHDVTVVRTRLPYPNDPKEDLYPTAAAEEPFARELMRRIKEMPGVESVALGSGAAVPLDHPERDQTQRHILIDGAEQNGQSVFVTGSEVTPEYFHLLRMSLVKGRLLDDFDTEMAPPVAVINESMARTYWPNDDPLGKRLKLTTRATEWATIVGIVADARTESLATSSVPHLYASLYQREGKHLAIFLRGRLETAAVGRAVRDHVQALNSALPVFGVRTLDETLSASLAVRRLSMELIALFAATALLLAALGIYGVISYMVGERTHEIGVRLALGARPSDVMGIVMQQGIRLTLVGAALGLAGSLIASRAMASLLVGVTPTDPLTFLAAAIVLAIVAMAGCYFPARRAIRVDPIVALKAS